VVQLVEKYDTERDALTRTAMQLAVMSEQPYPVIMQMTNKERKILVEVIKEKSDAQNPNKQRQEYL
jgi:hypothetical protein